MGHRVEPGKLMKIESRLMKVVDEDEEKLKEHI
jgi:hypothetical protein